MTEATLSKVRFSNTYMYIYCKAQLRSICALVATSPFLQLDSNKIPLFSSGYQVQVLPTRGSGDWRPINMTPVKGTTFKAPNLIEGADYEFRVVAINDAGLGKPSKSTGKHTVRDPICKRSFGKVPDCCE